MLKETFQIIFKLQVIKQIEKTQEQNIPKIHQVYIIIKEVKKQYPHLHFKTILGMVCDRLVEYKLAWSKELGQNIIAERQEQRLKRQRQMQEVINNQVVQLLRKDKMLQKQLHDKLLKRQKEKAFVAMLLVKRGYGLLYFRQQMQSGLYDMKMIEVRYKTCSACVVGETFRKIQNFLKNEHKIPIKMFTSKEIRAAYHILLNYKTYLSDNETNTFLKFVKWCYKIQNVTLQIQETITLYQKVRDRLNRKVYKEVYGVTPYSSEKSIKDQTMSISSASGQSVEQSQWEKAITEEFVEYYAQTNSVGQCRDLLVRKHGSRRQFCQLRLLYSRLYKYFRRGYKKLRELIPKYNIDCQNLPYIGHELIRKSLTSPEAVKFRRCLIKLMKTDRPTIQMIQQCAYQLEKYGRERLIETLSSQPEYE